MAELGRRLVAGAATLPPGLVVVATEDHYADTVATMHSMAANLGADTVVLDGLHHWWMFEGAETVADALVAHWDR